VHNNLVSSYIPEKMVCLCYCFMGKVDYRAMLTLPGHYGNARLGWEM